MVVEGQGHNFNDAGMILEAFKLIGEWVSSSNSSSRNSSSGMTREAANAEPIDVKRWKSSEVVYISKNEERGIGFLLGLLQQTKK